MKHIGLFIISFIFWLLLTWTFELASIVAGLLVAGLTAIIFGKYFFEPTKKVFQIHRYIWGFCYIFIFTWECIKANIDVAYRVLHPRMPVKPCIIRVPLNIKTSFARTMLACSITMTPGTIVMDIIDNDMYVHWIYMSSDNPDEYAYKIAGKFEKHIKKIFE